MKIYKILLIISVAIFTSCEDFLNEVNTIKKSDQLVYSTPEALESLVATCYSYNRLWYGKEAGFTMSEGGTDIWYNCKDNTTSLPFSTYNGLSSGLTSFPFDQYWEGFYAGINLCNTAQQNIEANTALAAARKPILLSEVRFLRAFYYWHLVETWGPVPLHISPITDPSITAERNSVDEIYAQMFEDVQFGIDNLPQTAPSSRVTYWAAKAFKARLALYYASEYGKTEYYAIAASEAKDVITSSGKALYDNYSDVWKMDNEAIADNKEFIWGVDYYNTIAAATPYNSLPARTNGSAWHGMILRAAQATAGGGNCQHLWVTPVWHAQTTSTGGKSLGDILLRYGGVNKFYTAASPNTKVDVDLGYFYVPYSLGYVRYAPTRYLLDLYDETKDQRWDVSFRSVWYKHPSVAPKGWGTATCDYPKMSMGTNTDTALFYSKRVLTAAQKAWAAGRYKAMDVAYCFGADGETNTTTATDGGATMYIAMRKFENTKSQIAFKAGSNFNDYFSGRDFPVFRISEMYLIVAEAELSSNASEALTYINALRTKRAIAGKTAEMQLATVNIDKILEERALEFCAENIRWFDLKRTNKLETQIAHNKNAVTYFQSYHYLRPIPALEYSLMGNKSETVGTGFWQNPGY
jgi:starch-binding outer membrane protein, SusD/RagB family